MSSPKKPSVEEAEKAVLEFMDTGEDWVMTIHEHRYGGAVVALICHQEAVEKIIDSIEGQNGEREHELWGLQDAWYPAQFGGSPTKAIHNLGKFLLEHKEEWDIMRFGIRRLIEDHVGSYRQKCLVKTFEALRTAMCEWNKGEEIRFF